MKAEWLVFLTPIPLHSRVDMVYVRDFRVREKRGCISSLRRRRVTQCNVSIVEILFQFSDSSDDDQVLWSYCDKVHISS